jgi:hypothetical protein
MESRAALATEPQTPSGSVFAMQQQGTRPAFAPPAALRLIESSIIDRNRCLRRDTNAESLGASREYRRLLVAGAVVAGGMRAV